MIHRIGDVALDEKDVESPKVYPNPAQDFITIEAQGDVRYGLYNPIGQCVVAGTFRDKAQIATSNLAQGLYYLHLHGESGTHVEKVVVEK